MGQNQFLASCIVCHFFACSFAYAVDKYPPLYSSILSIEGEKIYLNPDKIVVAKEGLFLLTDEDAYLSISALFNDAEGIFTLLASSSEKKNFCNDTKIL
jgi:hypothetical protein